MIKKWLEALLESPNTSLLGLSQLVMAVLFSYETYRGTIPLGTGLPIAATSFAGGIGNLLAGDAGKRWRGTNYSKEPAGECSTCRYRFDVFESMGCDRRGHQVCAKDTCEDWKPVSEIHSQQTGS